MLTTVITLLIYIVLLAIVMYLIIWVLDVVGINLPPKIIQLLWVVVALVAILLIVQALLGGGLPRLVKTQQQPEPYQPETLAQKLAVPNIMVPERR